MRYRPRAGLWRVWFRLRRFFPFPDREAGRQGTQRVQGGNLLYLHVRGDRKHDGREIDYSHDSAFRQAKGGLPRLIGGNAENGVAYAQSGNDFLHLEGRVERKIRLEYFHPVYVGIKAGAQGKGASVEAGIVEEGRANAAEAHDAAILRLVGKPKGRPNRLGEPEGVIARRR